MKIGIINDRPATADFLQRMAVIDPLNQVVWIAQNADQALTMCMRDKPDLILLDIVLRRSDGVETTRRIMTVCPCPILIVTASVEAHATQVFEAMGFGALDAMDTPPIGRGTIPQVARPLLAKITAVSRLVQERRGSPRLIEPGTIGGKPRHHHRLIAIGASTGGPAVLATLLHDLPKDLAAAVVIVQHVDVRFASGMAAWLNQETALPVRVAVEGDRPAIGEVLLAATCDHLAVKSFDRIGYTAEPIDYVYRPSVDVFFHSACRLWHGDIVGVLLTGMGRDGAHGLKALRDRGHYTIAQDEATCAVYGMPKAAAAIGAAIDVLPAQRIASKLIEVLAGKVAR